MRPPAALACRATCAAASRRQFALAPARGAASARPRAPRPPGASKEMPRAGPGQEVGGGGVAAPPPEAGGGGDGAAAGAADAPLPPPQSPSPLTPALLLRAAAAGTAAGAWEVLADAGAAPTTEAAGTSLISAALEAGCVDLAKVVYGAMAAAPAAAARRAAAGGGAASPVAVPWPRAGPASAAALVCGLARALRPAEAEAVLDVVRTRGEGALPAALLPGQAPAQAAGGGGGGSSSPLPGAWPAPAAADVASSSSSSPSPVAFGVVVSSPGAPGVPLTVIQPAEGGKVVACAACRYEFETWSGTVTRAASTPLGGGAGGVAGGALGRGLVALGRAAAAAAGRPPPPAAVHELDVRAPPGPADTGGGGGRSRPFRFATAGGAAPAAVGDRVTIVCTPLDVQGPPSASAPYAPPPSAASPGDGAESLFLDLAALGLGGGGGGPGFGAAPPYAAAATAASPPRPAFTRARRGLLAPLLPGTAPGQPLLVANHAAGTETAALAAPPPPPGAPGGGGGGASAFPPPWVGPLMLTLIAADVAAGVADPGLPLALAAAAAAAAGGGAALARWGVPALRRLPAAAVEVEASRQALLTQHVRLTSRAAALRAAAAADVRALARIWALRGKMGAVGGGAGDDDGGGALSDGDGEYVTRSARLAAAAADLEARLGDAMRLLAGYARLAGRVEIEVELEAGVPAGEAGALGAAGDALDAELASLGEAWRARAAAADEVERLLGS